MRRVSPPRHPRVSPGTRRFWCSVASKAQKQAGCSENTVGDRGQRDNLIVSEAPPPPATRSVAGPVPCVGKQGPVWDNPSHVGRCSRAGPSRPGPDGSRSGGGKAVPAARGTARPPPLPRASGPEPPPRWSPTSPQEKPARERPALGPHARPPPQRTLSVCHPTAPWACAEPRSGSCCWETRAQAQSFLWADSSRLPANRALCSGASLLGTTDPGESFSLSSLNQKHGETSTAFGRVTTGQMTWGIATLIHRFGGQVSWGPPELTRTLAYSFPVSL